MSKQLVSIIGAEDTAGPGRMQSVSPATEEELGVVAALDGAGAEDAVSAARDAGAKWRATSIADRQRLLRRWLDLMVQESDELAELVARENGKPVAEARLVDLFPACETLDYYSRHLAHELAFRPQQPNQLLFRHWRAGYRFDPLGVIAVIASWNYPVGIPVTGLVQAIGAGNTVVFKPASATVLVGLHLADQARRAGFPPGVFNAVALPGSATDALVDHPDVAKVLFTGSVDIGRHVAARCARRLAPSVLELGGKDAAVVAADADLERTARGLVWGAFMNTGQTCASIERVYAERSVADRLIERIVELTDELVMGDPLNDGTDIGPMTTEGQRETVAFQVEAAVRAGATALTGGEKPDGPGWFYPPTVLVDVNHDMEVMTEETFGPVLPIVAVDDLDEAVSLANDSRFGLTASGWTRSKETAAWLEAELEVGVVTINDHAVAFAEPTGSWGGVRESGIGRTHGPYGLQEMVNVKYVARDMGRDEAAPWYYPYDGDFGGFLEAALPALYACGGRRFGALLRLARTKRFIQRVRKGTMVANLDALL